MVLFVNNLTFIFKDKCTAVFWNGKRVGDVQRRGQILVTFFSPPAPPLYDVKGGLWPNLEIYMFILVLNVRSTGFLIVFAERLESW